MHASTTGIYFQDQYVQQLNCPVKSNATSSTPYQQMHGGLVVASDINGNSPTTFYAPAGAQHWAAIGEEVSDKEQQRYFVTTTPNGVSAALPAPRWNSCFPPPSFFPWWCISSDSHADSFTLMSNEETSSTNTPTPSNPDLVSLNGYVGRLSLDVASRSSDGQPSRGQSQQQPQAFGSPLPVSVMQSPNGINADFTATTYPTELMTNGSSENSRRVQTANFLTDQTIDSMSFDLRQILQNQLEYYFSRENLAVDTYLKSQMDNDQYVPIKVVATFNKVRKLTLNYDLIVAALRDSTQVQVDEKGEKVRALFKRSTLVLRDMSPDTDEKEVLQLFIGEKCPKVVSCEYAHNNSWYVNFQSDEDAQKAYFHLRQIAMLNGKPIQARIKSAPIPRQSQRQNVAAVNAPSTIVSPRSSADDQTSPGVVVEVMRRSPSDPPSSTAAVTSVDGSVVDDNSNGASSSASTTLAAAPPMDPIGAACFLRSSPMALASAAVMTSSMPPIAAPALTPAFLSTPRGLLLYTAMAAPPPTMSPAMALRVPPPSASIAPYWASQGLTMPYLDINQILSLNSLQAHNVVRPGVQLLMPTLTSNAGAFFDRRNKRNNSAGQPFHNKFYQTCTGRPSPLIAAGAFRPSYLVNNLCGGGFAPNPFSGLSGEIRRMPPHQLNSLNRPYNIQAQQPHWSDGTNQRSMTPNVHYSNNRSSSPVVNSSGFNSNNGHRNNSSNSTSNNSINCQANNGQVYSGRSSSSNSDYWSSQKDFNNSPLKHRPRFTKSHGNGPAMTKNDADHDLNSSLTNLASNHEKPTAFDFQSSSFPPLSETNAPQPNAKMSYAEKAKTAVVRNGGAAPNPKGAAPTAEISTGAETAEIGGAPATVETPGADAPACNANSTGFTKDSSGRKPNKYSERRNYGRSYYNRNALQHHSAASNSSAVFPATPQQPQPPHQQQPVVLT